MIAAKLVGTETSTLPITNDFRTYGLIRSPKSYGLTTIAAGSNYKQTTTLTMSTVYSTGVDFTLDETVTQGSATGEVVSWTAAANGVAGSVLEINNVSGTFTNSVAVVGATSGVSYTTDTSDNSGVGNPGLEPYTGQIVYIENRSKITRSTSQTEELKIILAF